MINSIRAGSQLGINWGDQTVQANIYVLGDGVQPFTSILLAALLPVQYRIYSIDPMLNYSKEQLGGDNELVNRISLHACLSQDFEVPATDDAAIISYQ